MTQPNNYELAHSVESQISAELAAKQVLSSIANGGNTVIANEQGLPFHSANVQDAEVISFSAKKERKPHKLSTRVAAITFAAGTLIAACGGADKEVSSSPTTTTVESNVEEDQDFTGIVPVISTDSELATGENLNGDFFCGGGYDEEVNGEVSRTDLSYKMDFLLANPEIEEGAYNVLVNDSVYGFGKEAADIIAKSSLVRSETVDSVGDKTLGDEDKDALLVNNLWTLELKEDTVVENGTCRFGGVEMPARDIPQLLLKAGTTVEGYMLSEEDFQNFTEVATNLDRFFTYNVSLKDEIYTFVVANSNGCDNPARVPQTPPVETTSTTSTTTTPTNTTTPPGTTVPVTTTTTSTTTSTSSTTVPGRKAVVPSTEAPSTPVTAEPRPSTTLAPQPATTAPDTIPAGVTTTVWDQVPTPSTIQEPDGPPVTATPPTTEAPVATIAPSTTVTSGTIVSP